MHDVERLPGKIITDTQKESWVSGRCRVSYEQSESSNEILLIVTGVCFPARGLSNKDIVDAIKQKFSYFCISEIACQNDELHIPITVLNPDEYPRAILDMVEHGNLKMEWNYIRDTKDVDKEHEINQTRIIER